MTAYNDSQNLSIYSVSIFSLQADVDEDKIKHFQKLKELPPMQLRQVLVYMVNWEQEKGLKYTLMSTFFCLCYHIYAFHSVRHPRPPILPVYPIICIGSYKEPLFQEILLYFL